MPELFTEFPFDIDVVYTWVDGTDPRWLEERKKHASSSDHASDAHDASRWEDYGTLKWSLRSVVKFMPWVRRIFVVTDGQKPSWLQEDDQLRIVSHAEVFADYVVRPTYNSHVIESQLHKIADLSEHFVYLNDDVLVTRQTFKSDFFQSNGVAKIFPGDGEFIHAGSKAVDVAGQNLQNMMAGKTWAPISRKMKHSAFALRRSVLQKMEIEYQDSYQSLGLSRFRSNHDFAPVSQLFPYFAYVSGQAVTSDVRTAYIDIGERMPFKNWVKLLTLGDYLTFCVNCSLSNPALLKRNSAWANRILGRAFAVPSRWEQM